MNYREVPKKLQKFEGSVTDGRYRLIQAFKSLCPLCSLCSLWLKMKNRIGANLAQFATLKAWVNFKLFVFECSFW